MRKGQVIHGYRVLEDFTTLGGGLCKWTFAEKGGQTYFLKEFLQPTYPVDGAPGSAETRAKKKAACETFEKQMRALISAVNGTAPAGGNLITAMEFFREGAKYYKATVKVDVASLAAPDVAGLPLDKRLLILLTVAHSLRVLHLANIVHGDLRPENVLLKQTITGDYAAKLIDFDSSYFSGNPPPRQELVGDPVYYSPEVGRYIENADEADAAQLTTQSDIFSLGLVYSQYLTGQFPSFSREKYRYPYVAAGNGGRLTLRRDGLPPMMRRLLQTMLSPNPKRRPDIQQVFATLKEPAILVLKETRAPAALKEPKTPAAKATKAPAAVKKTKGKPARVEETELEKTEEGIPVETTRKLRGTMIAEVEPASLEALLVTGEPPAAGPEEAKGTSKLKGTLVARRDEE